MRQKCDERRVHSLGRQALTPMGFTPPSPAAPAWIASFHRCVRDRAALWLWASADGSARSQAARRGSLLAGQPEPISGFSRQSQAPVSAEARVQWCLSTRNSKLKSHFNIVGTLQAFGLSHRRGFRVILVISIAAARLYPSSRPVRQVVSQWETVSHPETGGELTEARTLRTQSRRCWKGV